MLSLDIASRVSRGAPWPDAPEDRQPVGGVVLLGAEDDHADTIRPRLDAHEADCTRIIALTAVRGSDDEGNYRRAFDLSRDIDRLADAIDAVRDCRLVIVDPISAYMGKADSHNNAEVRSVLTPLGELAAEKRIAVLAITHLRKGDGAAMYRAMGSLAFVAAARAAWVVCQCKSNSRRRLLLPVKNNLADDAANGLAFRIEPQGAGGAPVVCWEREPVTITAEEAMAPEPKKRGRPAEARQDAERWLRETLSDGPRLAEELIAEVAASQRFSQRTLDRAQEELGVVAYQPEIPGPWWWRLPEAPQCHNGDLSSPPQEFWHSGTLANFSADYDPFACQNATMPKFQKE